MAQAPISRQEAIRQSLTVVKISDTDTDPEDPTCSICRFGFEDPERPSQELLTRINQCGHVFGQSCITNWFEVADTCPQCRAKAFTIAVPEKPALLVEFQSFWERLVTLELDLARNSALVEAQSAMDQELLEIQASVVAESDHGTNPRTASHLTLLDLEQRSMLEEITLLRRNMLEEITLLRRNMLEINYGRLINELSGEGIRDMFARLGTFASSLD